MAAKPAAPAPHDSGARARCATGRAAPYAEYEQPAQSNEAPAEFALFDAFAEDDEPMPAEAVVAS